MIGTRRLEPRSYIGDSTMDVSVRITLGSFSIIL
jgi:hypothetical protein